MLHPRKWCLGWLSEHVHTGDTTLLEGDSAVFQELWNGLVEVGPVPRKRKINGENARELALFSLGGKKSRERKEGRKTTPNNNFPNKTHIITRKPVRDTQQTLVDPAASPL